MTQERGETLIEAPASEQLAAELAYRTPGLPFLAAQVAATAEEIESSVVRVCAGFAGMVGLARASVEIAGAALRAAGHDSSSQPEGLTPFIGATRHTCDQVLAGVQETTARIHAAEAHLSAVLADLTRCAAVAGAEPEAAARTAQLGSAVTRIRSELAQLQQELQSRLVIWRMDVEQVLYMLGQGNAVMLQAIEQSRRHSATLAREIAHGVESLQFQDRVAQQLGAVRLGLEELHQVLIARQVAAGITPCDDRESWRAELIARSTMQSQRLGTDLPAESGTNQHSPPGSIELF